MQNILFYLKEHGPQHVKDNYLDCYRRPIWYVIDSFWKAMSPRLGCEVSHAGRM